MTVTVKGKMDVRFPANIAVNNVLTVTKSNGTYTFGIDYTLLGPGPISDPTTALIVAFDQTAGLYYSVSLDSLITSITPLPIARGGTAATDAPTARTNLGLGTIATQNANAVAVTGGTIASATITSLPAPINPSDAARLLDVSNAAAGITFLAASNLATAAVLPNTPTYANGTAGVGATLTAGANSTLTVDGTVAALNAVVLVKNQASAFQNGIYTVTTAGSGAAAWVLTRATYYDAPSEMLAGTTTLILGGATNIGTGYTLQTTVATVGTTAANFNQSTSAGVLSIGGSQGTVTIGPTLQIPGNVLATALGASVQTGSLSPTGTTSTTGKMMGLGLTGATITPATTGRVHFTIRGSFSNTVVTLTSVGLRFGTGTAPSNGAAPAGTQIGAIAKGHVEATSAFLPFTATGIATGLALGTPVWFDADLLVAAGSGTIVVDCSAFEF